MGASDRPWPADLDGPVAAPQQHRVIFENDRVRMLENAGDDDLVVIGVELTGDA